MGYFAAQLRKSRPDDLKVVLVTANHQEKVKEKSEEPGVTFIGKPATPKVYPPFSAANPANNESGAPTKIIAGLRSWTYRRQGFL